MRPFSSRSTIIAIVCILSFLVFCQMVLAAGYFDAGFGAAGIMFLSSVMKYTFDHQAKEGTDNEPSKEQTSK